MRNVIALLFLLVGISVVASPANAYNLFQCTTYAKYLAQEPECQILIGPSISEAFVVASHGAALGFANQINLKEEIGGNITVEPRRGAYGYDSFQLYVTLSQNVSSIRSVRCVDRFGQSIGSAPCKAQIIGDQNVIISTTGVPDGSRMKVIFSNVNGYERNLSFAVGFLFGDVDGSGDVGEADFQIINSQLTKPLGAATFKSDININGVITFADLGLANTRKGQQLKP